MSVGEDLHKAKTNYVRPGPQPANTDIKTYDVGNLFVVSQGVTTSLATCGELYVEYDIILKTPIFEPILPNGSLVNMTGANVTTSTLFGQSGNYVSSGNATITTNGANVVTLNGLQVGSEIVVSYGVVGAVIAGKITMAATSGLTTKTQVSPTWAADTMGASIQTFLVTASTAVITLSIAGGTITTPSLAVLTLSSYSPVLVGY
jgi:hypothetical protein